LNVLICANILPPLRAKSRVCAALRKNFGAHARLISRIFLASFLLFIESAFAERDFELDTATQVKLVYLLRLSSFVSWDGEDSGVLRYCTIGIDAVSYYHSILLNEEIKGKKIEVKYLSDSTEAAGCHFLYVASSMTSNLGEVISAVKELRIITIGNMDGFIEAGGMINLLQVDNNIRFEVNYLSIKDSKVELSSDFLRLAVRIIM
jgi:hypothetical protein